MAKLSRDHRGRIAEKVMEWGNLVFAGLVVAQVFSDHRIRLGAAIAGIVVLVGAYYFAYQFMQKGD
jgi:hypothetical protein